MPPGRGRGAKPGRTKPDHPPTTGRRDEDTPPRRTRPFPAIAPASSQKKKKQRRKKKRQQAAARLPEGPLVEILSRLPYSSLCRFKCVSKAWLALCSDPDSRKRSPQTLWGFFHNHHTEGNNLKFHNLSGRGPPLVDPSLPFLHGYESFMVKQCSSGLLLCNCWKTCAEEDECDLVVCNPATAKWIVLPPIVLLDEEDGDPVCYQPSYSDVFLGFDAAIPSRFVVFVPFLGRVDDVAIYLSETGRWIWGAFYDGALPVVNDDCVFMNGCIHLMIDESCIVAADTEGKDWNRIDLPEPDDVEPRYGDSSMGQSCMFGLKILKMITNSMFGCFRIMIVRSGP